MPALSLPYRRGPYICYGSVGRLRPYRRCLLRRCSRVDRGGRERITSLRGGCRGRRCWSNITLQFAPDFSHDDRGWRSDFILSACRHFDDFSRHYTRRGTDMLFSLSIAPRYYRCDAFICVLSRLHFAIYDAIYWPAIILRLTVTYSAASSFMASSMNGSEYDGHRDTGLLISFSRQCPASYDAGTHLGGDDGERHA